MSSVTAEWVEAFREAFRKTSSEMLTDVQVLEVVDLGAQYLAVVTNQSGQQFAKRYKTADLDSMTPPWRSRFETAHSLVIGEVLGSQTLESRRSSLSSESLYPNAKWSGSGPGVD